MSSDADPADPRTAGRRGSGIPALYTYLGQFIDHDLTFDPASSLQSKRSGCIGGLPQSGVRSR